MKKIILPLLLVMLSLQNYAQQIPPVKTEVVSALVLQPEAQDYKGASALMLLGAAGIVGSIPLFVASGKNNQKARVMLKQEKVSFSLPGHSGSRITGLTLSIPLGK